MAKRNFRMIIAILCAYTLLLVFFPLGMQAMEPYAYAAAAEGYYNLTATFALFQPETQLPDISAYHPNHPLGHLLPAFAFKAWGVDALTFARVRNAISALVFLLFFYLSAGFFVRRLAVKAAATLLTMFAYVFWNSALSGEVHMPALALNMVTVFFLLSYFKDARPHLLWLAAGFHILAGASHLTSVFLLPPAGIALIVHSHRREKWRLYLSLTVFILAGYAFFYVLLLIKILNIDSFEVYGKTFFIYNPILTKTYGSFEWWQITGKSLLEAFAPAATAWGLVVSVLLVILSVAGYAKLIRAKIARPQKVLLFGWPLFQIVIQIIVRGRPEGLNFWLFLTPPLFLATLFSLRSLAVFGRTRLFLIGAVAIVFAVNFFAGIFPLSRLRQDQYLLTRPHTEFAEKLPAAFVVDQPVLTFSEIWAAGSRYGLRSQAHFFPCCGEAHYAGRLRQWAKDKGRFLVFRDHDPADIVSMLAAEKIYCHTLQDFSAELMPQWIPVSVYIERDLRTPIRKELFILACGRP